MEALEISKSYSHIMEFSVIRMINSLFTLLYKGIEEFLQYKDSNKKNISND